MWGGVGGDPPGSGEGVMVGCLSGPQEMMERLFEANTNTGPSEYSKTPKMTTFSPEWLLE